MMQILSCVVFPQSYCATCYNNYVSQFLFTRDTLGEGYNVSMVCAWFMIH